MGKRYLEPTPYRDKKCPHCGCYFTPRGLNGHIRFYHEGYEKQEMVRLKRKLFNKTIRLCQRGHSELKPLLDQLGTYSDTPLDELREIEENLDIYE